MCIIYSVSQQSIPPAVKLFVIFLLVVFIENKHIIVKVLVGTLTHMVEP